ncbi:glycosyltransferase family 2 protein [Methylobrevis albus]|uniref:Glycosyltransferase family 2 protein n=1 Tax=Methylobrevis albus TaxID=2793297 RepID=A0A931MW83_9HYPH|nr:glycosyltransferase family 2 protein [Methylobrevis albus]MBH0236333.1 glycosyltransferase family 2 protein [Methylobrevis albus]
MSEAVSFDEGIRTAEAAIRDGDHDLAGRLLATLAAARRDEHPARLALEAALATATGDFHAALRAWQRYEALFGIRGRDRLKHAAVLERLGRIGEAIAVYRAIPTPPGSDHRGVLQEARLHGKLGNHTAALAVLDAALQGGAGPETEVRLRAARARAAMAAGRRLDALTDFVFLAEAQPGKPTGLVGQIDVHLLHYDRTAAAAALARAQKRHPRDVKVLAAEARFIQQFGNDDDFVGFVQRLVPLRLGAAEVEELLAEMFGTRHLFFTEELRARLIAASGLPAHETILRGLLDEGARATPELRLAAARKAVDDVAAYPDSPRGLKMRVRLASALIEAGAAEEAETVIDGLAATVRGWPYSPPLIGELLEWQAVRRGDVAGAQASYWHRRRMIARRDRSDELECLRALPGPPPPVVVVCQLRNEMPMLPAFFRHYRKIGVERFVMIDNGSSDGSTEWLSAQPDTELFRSASPFRRAEAGNAWTNPLIARPAYADTLCLRVDADEHLVYPHVETRPVAALWDYMQGEGAEVLAGHMLDMLPETLAHVAAPEADFTERARFFEPPPPPMPVVTCPYFSYRGGPRTRLLGIPSDHLTKCSGLRGGGTVEQTRASHRTSPARVASVGMVLLHYKFRPDFFERARRVAAEHQYASASQSFSRYQLLEDEMHRSVLSAETRPYTGSASLLAAGVLKTTPGWDAAGEVPAREGEPEPAPG